MPSLFCRDRLRYRLLPQSSVTSCWHLFRNLVAHSNRILELVMVRFLGVTLAPAKRLWVALQSVHGIGESRAHALCHAIGATSSTTAGELRPFHISQLYAAVDARYTVGGDLRDANTGAIQRLMKMRCYRGIRHQQRLPVRGQNTQTNARTSKRRNPPRL